MPINITNEMAKSIRQTITVLAGTIKRGKYTLVSKLEFAKRELLASLNELEKNCHGNVAAETSNKRGILSGVEELNSQPINAITNTVSNGRSTLHNTPITVCL